MEDRRAIRTKRELKRAMLQMLQEREINQITVSELSDMADIGRGTFYLHYRDPYDLLEHIEDELLVEMGKITQAALHAQGEDAFLACQIKACEYINENREPFQVLMSAKRGTQFFEKIKEFYTKMLLNMDENPSSSIRYSVLYWIYGSLGVIQEWIRNGFELTPQEVAVILQKAIQGKGR